MKRQILFKHSGNIGDLVYSLPSIRAAAEFYDIDAHLRINVGAPMVLYHGATHPNGGVMVSDSMFNMTIPLIEKAAPYIKSVARYNPKEVGEVVDLDEFRNMPINFAMGNITTWYADVIGVYPDLNTPWLYVDPADVAMVSAKLNELQPGFTTVAARSSRYRNPHISFSGIDSSKTVVIGHHTEWNIDMQKDLPNAKFFQVENFYQMACIIAASKLFIGNQSMPFSIAEGLKHTRLLEPCLFAGNVHPVGGKCALAYTQKPFLRFAEKLLQS